MTNGAFGTLITLGVGVGIGYFLGSDKWRTKHDNLAKAFKIYSELSDMMIKTYQKELEKVAKEQNRNASQK